MGTGFSKANKYLWYVPPNKRLFFHLIATVQLIGGGSFDSKRSMNTVTGKKDVSLEMEFQKHLSR